MKRGLIALSLFMILISSSFVCAQNSEAWMPAQNPSSVGTANNVSPMAADCSQMKKEISQLSPSAIAAYDEQASPCKLTSLQINYVYSSGTILNFPPRNTAIALPQGASVSYNSKDGLLIIHLVKGGNVAYGPWEKEMNFGDYIYFSKTEASLKRENVQPWGFGWLAWLGNYFDSKSLEKEKLFDSIGYYSAESLVAANPKPDTAPATVQEPTAVPQPVQENCMDKCMGQVNPERTSLNSGKYDICQAGCVN